MTNQHQPVASALFMLAAAAFMAGATLLAKVAGNAGLHPLQVSHGRFLFALLGIVIATAILRPKFTRPDWKVHLARSTAGWAGISLTFAAIQFIPLGDATAISFLNPVFAMLLAIPVLGEKVGPWRWLAAGLALIGGAILLRPGSGTLEPGALIALAAAVVIGIELTIIKFLTGREAPIQILLVNNTMGLMIATLAVLVTGVWRMPDPATWAVLGALGGLMALAQTCFIQSMRRADASFAAPFFYMTLVFAALYDGLIFGVWPGGTSILGAGTILAGGALLAWREGRLKKAAG